MSTNPFDRLDNEPLADQLTQLEALSTDGMSMRQKGVLLFRMNCIRAAIKQAAARVRGDAVDHDETAGEWS